MTVAINPEDLFLSNVDNDRAMTTIATVIARAGLIAPCILEPAAPAAELAVKGILVDVIVRRYKAHQLTPGVARSRTMGGRSETTDTKDVPTALFYPAEILELQAICRGDGAAAEATSTPVYSFPDAQPWPDGLSRRYG